MKRLANFILLIICGLSFTLYGRKDSSKSKEPFVYTASLLMEDTYNILDYYSTTTSLTKLEDNSIVSSENCLFSSTNEKSSNIILDSLSYWDYCKNGGQSSYTETNFNIVHRYTFDFNGTTCSVEYTYQNNNSNPTSSGFRRTYTYDISFSTDHIKICYEDKYESHYNKTKHYIDICSIENGILMQYYISKNNDYYLEIYQFFYNKTQDYLYFNSNRLKEDNSIKTLNDISLIDFTLVELPEFLYKL